MDQLSTTESKALATHEKTIRQGMQGFVEVGIALREIRDGRLYRATHESFEEYLEERWEMHRSRAYQYIEAAGAAENVNPCQSSSPLSTKLDKDCPSSQADDVPPIPTERIAREVATVPKEDQKAVWKEAVETAPKDKKGKPKVTAKHVQKVAAKRVERADDKPQPAKPADPGLPFATESDAVDAVLDQIETLLRTLSKLLDATKSDKKCKAPFAHFIPYLGGIGAIGGAVETIRQNLPGAVHADNPGYIPRRSVKQRADYAKGGK